MSEKSGCCMHRGANSVAGRMPDQRATGCGSRHRRSPIGGAAKGMPLKIRRDDGPASDIPWSLPLSTATIGPPAANEGAANIANANASPTPNGENHVLPSLTKLFPAGLLLRRQ